MTPPSDSPLPPAYVAPIPSIGCIPPLSPSPSPTPVHPGPLGRPTLPPAVGRVLTGKCVNEYGELLDDDHHHQQTARVCAWVRGDLPSMVGRRVANAQGDILGDHGELLGWVAEWDLPRAASSADPSLPRGAASLMVDDQGVIRDVDGNVVGKLHDQNNPLHRKAREEQDQSPPGTRSEDAHDDGAGEPESGQAQRENPAPSNEQPPPPPHTPSEPRPNAESGRRQHPSESPSDIFLDVKSTTEGIQLTIRIPTVFGLTHPPARPTLYCSRGVQAGGPMDK